MVKVVFEGHSYELPPGESLLDGLLNQGVSLAHGCRTGSCQSCLLKCTKGRIPDRAQQGLKPAHQANHFFLACQCVPEQDMQVRAPNTSIDRLKAKIKDLHALAPGIMEVLITPDREMKYRAGQFIHLFHPEGPSRSYSLASVFGMDNDLILHVKEYPQGKLSSWIHHGLTIGNEITISEAMGDCFYLPGHPTQPLLLIGTGTGLAPLIGIAKDALQQGHQAPIHLFHGVKEIDGLYLSDALNEMQEAHPQFTYTGAVSDPDVPLPLDILRGRASEIAFATYPELKGWHVYICGNPDMVKAAQMQAYLANASLNEIHVDPFVIQS